MGGSGGSFFSIGSLDRLRQSQAGLEDQSIAGFQPELAAFLGELLTAFNDRDTTLVQKRLEEVKQALRSDLEGAFDTLFGGSVAKHTYVDGLSDVDCLTLIGDSELSGNKPSDVLKRMKKTLRKRLQGIEVTAGSIAVTLEYHDGMSIQLLPAERDQNGRMRVPSWQRDEWSRIEPEGFLRALRSRNGECGAKLVPTIKLAKSVIATLPAGSRIAGYHVESLAIEAFRDYAGPKTTSAMLPTFFERARTLVLTPMRDSTGQSIHVDYELGAGHSPERQTVSLHLGRIAKRMRVASAAGSLEEWRDLFGLND